MTGPEHYREAERLILQPDDLLTGIGPECVAVAQVHATLALAAATAMCGYAEHGMHYRVYNEWSDACDKA